MSTLNDPKVKETDVLRINKKKSEVLESWETLDDSKPKPEAKKLSLKERMALKKQGGGVTQVLEFKPAPIEEKKEDIEQFIGEGEQYQNFDEGPEENEYYDQENTDDFAIFTVKEKKVKEKKPKTLEPAKSI